MVDRPVIVINGANSGLGYATTQALIASSHAYTILLGCMNLADGQVAAATLEQEYTSSNSIIEPVKIDITSDASIAVLIQHIQTTHGRIDTPVNIAEVSLDNRHAQNIVSARDAWSTTFSVDLTSTAILTDALMPLLLTPAPESSSSSLPDKRIMFITSGTSPQASTTRMDTPFDGGSSAW